MIRVAAIVEGYGDVQAVPALVSKTGAALGQPAIAPDPIRAGEWKQLRRPGSLEKYLELAASRNPDMILVVLDLDDGCPVDEAGEANQRIINWKNNRPLTVEVVFIYHEYETIFLQDPSCLPIVNEDAIPDNPESIRGAKERIKLITGKRYKETQDQLRYTQSLNVFALFNASRSYRRFCKALSGVGYDVLSLL